MGVEKEKQEKLTELWVIYDKQEKCFIKFGNKAAWVSSAAAKNAWNYHNHSWREKVTFNEQTRYIIVNVFDNSGWKLINGLDK